MAKVIVHGVPLQVDGVAPGGAELRQIAATLELLPPSHLRHLPTITVGDRPPRGGGGSAHAGLPGGPYLRLNRTVFDPRERPVNAGAFNYTLLHECGHLVDWAYGCMPWLRRYDPIGYAALLAHPHRGATQGEGEHYADAYADYFWVPRVRSGAPMRQSRPPVAIDPRMRAVLNSPAFRAAWAELIGELISR